MATARFTDSAAAVELADRAERLVEEVVLPNERSLKGGTEVSRGGRPGAQGGGAGVRRVRPADRRGVGRMGYSFRDVLPTFELASRSSLGTTAMRVDAPDEVHRYGIAREEFESVDDAELDPIVRYDQSL